MNSTVVLTIEHQLHAQLLKHALANCPDIELVGEATGLIESMMLIDAKKPDVWIHSWAECPQVSAALSQIYSRDPNLTVIRFNPDEPAGFIQMRVNSLPELLRLAAETRHLLKSA